MKKLWLASILMLGLCTCQTQKDLNTEIKGSYSSQWENINELIKKGFPEKAITSLDDLIVEARENKDPIVATQAILKKINLKNLVQEDFMANQMAYLKSELDNTKDDVSQAFLNYTIAIIYNNYWESNQNVIPEEMSGDDDMSGKQYYDTIAFHFDQILTDEIKNLSIKDVQSFFNEGNYDPSVKLWDFFMLEKIKLWKSNPYIKYLGEEEQRSYVQNLYDVLINKLKKNKQTKLQLLTEIEKNQFFNLDIAPLYAKYGDTYQYILDYHTGKELSNQANQSDDKKEKSDLLQESYAKFESVLNSGDDVFVNNAKVQIEQIEKINLQVSVEQIVMSELKSLAYISYKNLDKVYVKIYQLSEKDMIEERREKGFPYKNRTVVYEKEILLSAAQYKYVEQSSEIEIPALQPGFYGIVVNTEMEFKIADKNPLYTSNFLATNIGLNSFFDAKTNKVVLQCINRMTGEVLNGANFKILDRQYNRGQGQQMVTVHEGKGNPDFKYDSNPSKNYFPYVKYGDHFFMERNGFYTSQNRLSNQLMTNLLTDRGIYRPGQEIHFQGILYRIDEQRVPSIHPNQKLTIQVNDNFGNKVMEETLTTDEYGAYDGVFNIPDQQQNGSLNFRFKVNNQMVSSYTSIKVEEYKRPKYEVSFEDVNQELALDKNIRVEAKAISFTGVPISDAKVVYKVHRSTWIPYFYRGFGSHFPPRSSENTLIKSGEVKTNEAGEIAFDFFAERSLTHPNLKSFNYTVEIDVIDNTGETKSVSKNISISEQSVFIKFAEDTKRDEYFISTVNAEDKLINAKVDLTIYKKEDTRFKVDRYWGFPDTTMVSPIDFPAFSFTEDDKMYTSKVYEASIDVRDTAFLDLNKLLGAGNYKVEIKSDGANDFESKIEINNFESGEFGINEVFYIDNTASSYAPGEEVEIKLGSAIPALRIHVQKYKNSNLVEEFWTTLDPTFSISNMVTDSDYGGYSYLFKAYYMNRYFEKSLNVNVPWNHKRLYIKPKTIRYVTEPGAPEKWTFVVTDENGDPVKSRLLSSMYDASLDEFQPFSWNWNLFPTYHGVPYTRNYGYGNQFLYTSNYSWNRINGNILPVPYAPSYLFSPITWSQFGVEYKSMPRMSRKQGMVGNVNGEEMEGAPMAEAAMMSDADNSIAPPPPSPSPTEPTTPPAVRTNLAELVFFYPDLTTNEDGEVTIEFNNNEALTKWKLQNFAYTKDLKYGFSSEEIVTKKELMIQANQPRFLRVGDKISLSAKLINLAENAQSVNAKLAIYDEQTKKEITINGAKNPIKLDKDGQEEIFWEVEVPDGVQLVKLVYSVSGEKHEDAEQHIVPVMPKDIYLIDSETILLDANSSGGINLSALFDKTKRTSALTIETTGSPAWYAVRTLPYLMENDEENSEAVFNRYFANALALKILNENPLIEAYYKKWKAENALKSTLTLNESLKNIDLSQTPWIKDALSEEETMHKMANLFDRAKVEMELKSTLAKLKSMQLGDGGFPWYQGGRANYYMSQYILEGFLKMEELGLGDQDINLKSRLFNYCANMVIKMSYDGKDHVPSNLIRNVWINEMMTEKTSGAYLRKVNMVKKILEEKWFEYGIQDQVYIAKIFKKEKPELMKEIASSLLEKSFYKEQLGRFWNSNPNGIYSSWDISLQASLISLFNSIGGYDDEVDEMKFWLIANKRTNSWDSNIATSSAVYALTLGKSSAFAAGKAIVTSIDGKVVKGEETSGINYEKIAYSDRREIGEMKEVEFENSNDNKAWANVHHQFFQDYNDVERTDNAFLDIKKEIYKIGLKDELVNVENHTLQLGDRIKVRLTINSDRPMEFVHVSDDRPAGCEPVDLSSGYSWNNRLSYYKSIKDLGTHFFIDQIAKGKYVIEYEMYINNLGAFNSGVAEIQNVYAPEFNDYSKSVRINVE
ncbi:alpha-2-macroglobulin family protein [Portibacter lacus]|uniref:Alpha-2-macroglobulin n=1 Tax=Portibacter lacus TaxID=1099794 RepID=A0AA37SR28_9BACT|nr:alpha-2-macroglobulin family protein [Portibacter lacus]GLR18422.1 alpha-2-macroglobulin [Portibacter lacus]